MKKYTIIDSRGNKKIIYANNITNAIKLAGIKMRDRKMRDSSVEDRVDDILEKLNIDYAGDTYSGIELRRGSREAKLFENALTKAGIWWDEDEDGDTHMGRNYVGYFNFRTNP